MKQVQLIMGMPITIDVADANVTQDDFDAVFAYFRLVDEQFSPYKATSEVSKIDRGELAEDQYSNSMKEVLAIAAQTKKDARGYFDVWHKGKFDPSGIVKGWSIYHAAQLLDARGLKNFYVDAGGDIGTRGLNAEGQLWRVGIRNPFATNAIIKTLALSNCGVATSGTYIRGQHIYNPHKPDEPIRDIVSLTVVGPNVLEADRYATAAFAMGKEGISFLATIPHLEAYMIDAEGVATMTPDFERYVFHE